jgi:hypothetical protein
VLQEAVRLLREACTGPLPALCYSVVLGGAAKEGHWREAIEVQKASSIQGCPHSLALDLPGVGPGQWAWRPPSLTAPLSLRVCAVCVGPVAHAVSWGGGE